MKGIMTEQDLMEWISENDVGSECPCMAVSAEDLRDLFKGMMLVPKGKFGPLTDLKGIYPVRNHCPENAAAFLETNDRLLKNIRRFEPSFPNLHSEGKQC